MHQGLVAAVETLKKQGFKVKLDTNGSRPDVVKGLVEAGLVDYIAMDVKGPLDAYARWCGCSVDRRRSGRASILSWRGASITNSE